MEEGGWKGEWEEERRWLRGEGGERGPPRVGLLVVVEEEEDGVGWELGC